MQFRWNGQRNRSAGIHYIIMEAKKRHDKSRSTLLFFFFHFCICFFSTLHSAILPFVRCVLLFQCHSNISMQIARCDLHPFVYPSDSKHVCRAGFIVCLCIGLSFIPSISGEVQFTYRNLWKRIAIPFWNWILLFFTIFSPLLSIESVHGLIFADFHGRLWFESFLFIFSMNVSCVSLFLSPKLRS